MLRRITAVYEWNVRLDTFLIKHRKAPVDKEAWAAKQASLEHLIKQMHEQGVIRLPGLPPVDEEEEAQDEPGTE